jgi:uncharacterized protein YecE (DUF72 family)
MSTFVQSSTHGIMKSPKPLPTVYDLPSATLKHLRIGTCSWKYPEWSRVGIYPDGYDKTSGNFLEHYAKFFNTVEIDQWFWSLYTPKFIRLPNPRIVQEYAQSVPKNFLFSVKAPNSITLTHFYTKGAQARQYPEYAGKPNKHFLDPELLRKFLKALEPMEGRLGPVMFEFEYLNKEKMESLDAFLVLLQRFFEGLPPGYHYGVETRNPNYLKPSYFSLLKKYKVAHVLLEGYYMPPVTGVLRSQEALTAQHTVFRLHGPNREGMAEKAGGIWDRVQVDRTPLLEEIGGALKMVIDERITAFVNVNNHFEGCAPVSIAKLLRDFGVV